MADEQQKDPSVTGQDAPKSSSQPTQDGGKVTSAAQPQQVAPGPQEGVQVGGLNYTENEDGTRNYPDQKPVQTVDDPTPTPEQVDAQAPQPTSQPAGQ